MNSSSPLVAYARHALFGTRRHETPEPMRDALWSRANAITVARAIVTVALFIAAMLAHSHAILIAGFAASVLGDIGDGAIARSKDCVTVIGAQLDGLADRLAAVCVLTGIVALSQRPTLTALAAAGVWLHYGVVDQLLSMQFVRFGLWSPDEFFRVSPAIWRQNWSGIAKLLSSLPIVLFVLGGWAIWPALALSLLLLASRASGYVREHDELYRVQPPRDEIVIARTTAKRDREIREHGAEAALAASSIS